MKQRTRAALVVLLAAAGIGPAGCLIQIESETTTVPAVISPAPMQPPATPPAPAPTPAPAPAPNPAPTPAPAPPAEKPKAPEPAKTPPVKVDAVARTDEWWKKMHEAFLKRTRQGQERGDIGVVFMGDSITQQWGEAGKEVWAEKMAPRKAVNYGIGGDRTGHVLWRIQNGELDGLGAVAGREGVKVVVLMIGTNDAGANVEPETIAAGIKACVKAIREKLPATKVLVLGVLPRSEKPDALRERVKRVNELAKDVADGKMVFWQDDWDRFVQADGKISRQIMPDELHLSAKGYQVWAEAIGPSLDRLGASK